MGPSAKSPSPFTPWLRVLLGAIGAASFGLGIFALFTTENGTGTGVLLAFGGILSVLALLGNRIESFEAGGVSLRMRAEAAERFALAEEAEHRGEVATAGRLRAEAQALMQAAGPIATQYRTVRSSMPAGPDRTVELEAVVARARRLAREQPFDPLAVAAWLRDGTDEERVTALAMMQARPELRNFDAALDAIEHSHSAFEQYHAILLAGEMLNYLDPEQQGRLADVLESVRGRDFRPGGDRWQLSENILRRLASLRRSAGTGEPERG